MVLEFVEDSRKSVFANLRELIFDGDLINFVHLVYSSGLKGKKPKHIELNVISFHLICKLKIVEVSRARAETEKNSKEKFFEN